MYGVMIFAIPGAGKSTQAKLLAECRGWVHIDTSCLIVSSLQSRIADTVTLPDGHVVDLNEEQRKMDAGELIDSKWVLWLVRTAVVAAATCGKGVVFSGSPRRIIEAEGLLPVLQESYGEQIVVILLDVAENIARKRSQLRGRALDTHWDTRITAFQQDTMPTMFWVAKHGYPIHVIDASGKTEEIAEKISVLVQGVSE